MVPTRVGMNRARRAATRTKGRGPHTRGDEPDNDDTIFFVFDVVPTRVGMNRTRYAITRESTAWSPHAWG